MIDEHSYARLQSLDCENIDDSMTYSDFLKWNKECFMEIDEHTKAFLEFIFAYSDRIRLVDSETAFSSEPVYFFFNMSKKLCIANER